MYCQQYWYAISLKYYYVTSSAVHQPIDFAYYYNRHIMIDVEDVIVILPSPLYELFTSLGNLASKTAIRFKSKPGYTNRFISLQAILASFPHCSTLIGDTMMNDVSDLTLTVTATSKIGGILQLLMDDAPSLKPCQLSSFNVDSLKESLQVLLHQCYCGSNGSEHDWTIGIIHHWLRHWVDIHDH